MPNWSSLFLTLLCSLEEDVARNSFRTNELFVLHSELKLFIFQYFGKEKSFAWAAPQFQQ